MPRKTQSLIKAALESSRAPLAAIAREVGISDRHLRRIQRGDCRCSMDLRLRILRATGAPVIAGLLSDDISIDQLVKTYIRYLDDFVTTMLPLLSDLADEDALDPRHARTHAIWFAEQLRTESRSRASRLTLSRERADLHTYRR